MSENSTDEQAIFEVARKIDDEKARHAYVRQMCGEDTALERHVQALLHAYDENDSFLESPPLEFGSAPTLDRPITEKPGSQIGPYKLLQQIGDGGMGVVYMAEQTEPVQRRVALKIIKPGMDTRQVIARFEAERQALAMMDHPNIAKVLDAGTTDSGRPYFVMELVKGAPITQYCDDHQLSPRERLELFVPVCQAVQHAHQKGIIHRDIKPSNVLVCHYDDRPVPKIIDFGVAKATEHRLTEKTMFTEFGQVLGTLDYMSPEQARLSQLDIDTRSDIYSLGVLLYELLTGETPFDRERMRSAAFDELLRIIREEEPPKPSLRLSTSKSLSSTAANRHVEPGKLSTLVRGELDWIVMKALEKDRTRRYETATSFSADIERYLSDEPVQACPPSVAYRFKKFARRNRGILVALTTVMGALLLGVAISTWQAVRAAREADRANRAETLAKLRYTAEKTARREAKRRADELQRRNYFHLIALAQNAVENGVIRQANHLLNRCPEELRGWEWHRLHRLMDSSKRTLRGHSGRVWKVCYSPDGKRIASASWDQTVKVWDVRSGRELFSLGGHTGRVYAVAYGMQGKLLASSSEDTTVRIWDAETGKHLHTLQGHGTAVRAVAFSPSGETIVSGSLDSSIRLWNSESGKETRRWMGHANPPQDLGFYSGVQSLTFSPDGKWVVSGVYRTVSQWDAETGQLVRNFADDKLRAEGAQPWSHAHVVTSVAVSPDGRRIVSGGNGGVIKVWKAASGELQWVSPPQAMQVGSVAFSPDGKHVLAGYASGACRVWDADSGEKQYTLLGHLAPVASARFSPDGKQIVSGDWQYEIKLWDARPVPRTRDLRGHTAVVLSVVFHPDGQTVVSAGYDQVVKIWDLTTGQVRSIEHETAVNGLAIDETGKRIASCDSQGKTRIWDFDTLTLERTLPGDDAAGHAGNVNGVAFIPDSPWIVTCGDDATIRIWDTRDGRQRVCLNGHTGPVRAIALGLDGRQLVSAGNDGTVKIWDLDRREVLATLRGHSGEVCGVAFSPDGSRIVSCAPLNSSLMPGETILWDGRTRQQVAVIHNYAPRHAPAFSPDSSRIAVAGYDGRVLLLDAVTGEEAIWLRGHQGELMCTTFSPDGHMIAAAGREFTIKIWEIDQPR